MIILVVKQCQMTLCIYYIVFLVEFCMQAAHTFVISHNAYRWVMSIHPYYQMVVLITCPPPYPQFLNNILYFSCLRLMTFLESMLVFLRNTTT